MNNESLQEEFLIWRRRAKLTQAEAADKFGVTMGTISNWERGKFKMSDLACKLFKTFQKEQQTTT